MDKKKILILSYSDIASDPRVRRQIEALKDYDITTCGIGSECDYQIYHAPEFSLMRKIKRFIWLQTGQYEKWYWDDYKKELALTLSKVPVDVVIANDIHTLPLALKISSRVYFDAHEYHPKEWPTLKWKLLYKSFIHYLCRTYIPKANSFSTVSESIANEYQKFVGAKPVVISNAVEYQEFSPSPSHIPIRLIHHGASIPERKIEKMIEIIEYLPSDFIFYLMLSPFNQKYLDKLKKNQSNRVQFIPPVTMNKICMEINKYDIGIFLLPPVSFNYRHSLPNKIFEFVQARLAVVTSPNPEMKNLIDKYNLGKASETYTPKSMAEAVTEVAKKIPYFKSQSDKFARELSAENNYVLIRKLVSLN